MTWRWGGNENKGFVLDLFALKVERACAAAARGWARERELDAAPRVEETPDHKCDSKNSKYECENDAEGDTDDGAWENDRVRG